MFINLFSSYLILKKNPMTAEVFYEGDLRNKLTHTFSGTSIITDAPLDNEGKAQAFSPTDLMAASAGACALTIMGISGKTHGYSIEGARVEVTKVMQSNPRKISEIHLAFHFPKNNYSENDLRMITHIASNCPVMLSLHSDIKKEITLNF